MMAFLKFLPVFFCFITVPVFSVPKGVTYDQISQVVPYIQSIFAILFLLVIALLPSLIVKLPHNWKYYVLPGIAVFLFILLFLVVSNKSLLLNFVYELFAIICLVAFYYFLSGTIFFDVRFHGKPDHNLLYLFFTGILANFIGTIGATILFLQPLLDANRQRKGAVHIPIFFSLIVTNAAGMLTPFASSHVYFGYLRGIPGDWFLNMFPVWITMNGCILSIFFLIDWFHERDKPVTYNDRISLKNDLYRALQKHQVPQSLMVRVLDYLERPGLSIIGAGRILLILFGLIFLYQLPSLQAPLLLRELILVALAMIAIITSVKNEEARSHLQLDALLHMVLFYVLMFALLIPVILIIQQLPMEGMELNKNFVFIISLVLSAFVDNLAVMQLLFHPDTAHSFYLSTTQEWKPAVSLIPLYSSESKLYLTAIISGIALGGGLTYSSNSMNVYVKKAAERSGFIMPGFFKYMLYSGPAIFLAAISAILLLTFGLR